MSTYHFDTPIDRSGSGDLKHCVLEERYGRADLLPLWVADMDFETPPFITNALRRRMATRLCPLSCGHPSGSGFTTATSGM